jgi:hypothetical protein
VKTTRIATECLKCDNTYGILFDKIWLFNYVFISCVVFNIHASF